MRSPFRSFTHWITGTVLSLLVIITILLGYNFLSAEYAKFEALEQEQSVLHKVKNDLEGGRDKFAKELPARIPQPGTPLNLMAERIKVLESEINTRQATRQKLWDAHPIERHLPTSNPFREISLLDIEIAFLQQGVANVRKLHSLAPGHWKPNGRSGSFRQAATSLASRYTKTRKRNGNCPTGNVCCGRCPLPPPIGR